MSMTGGFLGGGLLFTFVGSAVAGSLLAFLASFGMVYSQTSAPSTNPADKAILTYGEN